MGVWLGVGEEMLGRRSGARCGVRGKSLGVGIGGWVVAVRGVVEGVLELKWARAELRIGSGRAMAT